MIAAVGIVLLQMQHMVPLAPADQFLVGHALVDKYIGEGKADPPTVQFVQQAQQLPVLQRSPVIEAPAPIVVGAVAER